MHWLNHRAIRLLSLFAACLAVPDEGQWLPGQVRAMDWDKLRARGLELTPDQLWHPEQGGVLTAAVQIGGCSASFVSADGLLVTNHHCGFGAINKLSTVQKNYLQDGFVAGSRAEELPTDMVVSIVRRIEDVTERIHAVQVQASGDIERQELTEAAIRALCDAAEHDPSTGRKDPLTTCSIASFLEGREYHLYYRTRLTDVRLVYAPPRAVGEYGGEIDNWEWPRHTGDFMFFRAYAAPDGTPRAHHAENVPYRPQHWLRVSTAGVTAGDLVLILGYPGSTERYLTSAAVRQRQAFFYPRRLDLFTRMIAVLEQAGEADPELALRLQSSIKSLANSQKNALGMVEGLARNGVVATKLAAEQRFRDWVAADESRRERLGTVLDDMIALDEEEASTQEKDLLIGILLGSFGRRALPLLAGLVELCAAADRMQEDEARLPRDLRRALGSERLTADFETVQQPLLALLLAAIGGLPEGQRIDLPEVAGDVVSARLQETAMLDPRARTDLARAGKAAVAASADPLIALARTLASEHQAWETRRKARAGARLRVGRLWIEAQQEWRGETFYPDANSTLRVSIAEVKGYEPRDGVRYVPHTTVGGLLEKATGEDPFAPPASLREAAADRRSSRFSVASLGDVPVCFLSDGDTTGGNSGSPVVNGKGELVGLNFDRVFENVAGDYGWNAARSRNISVDIRFVLWHIESVMPSAVLLRELLP